MNNLDDLTKTQIFPWHQMLWGKLSSRFPEVGHGLLFYGKQGCGKQHFSEHFTQWALCQEKQPTQACGKCSSCVWFAAGTHPQVKKIKPDYDEKKQSYSAIKIDQIRELNDFIQQTVDGWRIILIYSAELMNMASANALLKTLEEPGDRVLMILISDSILKLPATIRSRVQQYPLDRISLIESQKYLHQNLQINENEQHILLALAENMPLKACQIYESEWFKRRAIFFQDIIDLVKFKNHPIKFSSLWMKQLDFRDLLTILRYLIQDLVALKLGQQVKQNDLAIGTLAEYYSLEQLFAIYQQMNKIQLMSAQNIQAQLMFDELTMYLMNVES